MSLQNLTAIRNQIDIIVKKNVIFRHKMKDIEDEEEYFIFPIRFVYRLLLGDTEFIIEGLGIARFRHLDLQHGLNKFGGKGGTALLREFGGISVNRDFALLAHLIKNMLLHGLHLLLKPLLRFLEVVVLLEGFLNRHVLNISTLAHIFISFC